jgi:hypothetical protein
MPCSVGSRVRRMGFDWGLISTNCASSSPHFSSTLGRASRPFSCDLVMPLRKKHWTRMHTSGLSPKTWHGMQSTVASMRLTPTPSQARHVLRFTKCLHATANRAPSAPSNRTTDFAGADVWQAGQLSTSQEPSGVHSAWCLLYGPSRSPWFRFEGPVACRAASPDVPNIAPIDRHEGPARCAARTALASANSASERG